MRRPRSTGPASDDALGDTQTGTSFGQARGRPYIECRDLFKIYKRAELEVVALRGLDMEVYAGEMIAIVGTSGSGKSTLLNILSGLDRPSAGQVRVGNRDLLDISDRQLVLYRRLEVGFVWQATSRNLVPYLNVRDNMELPMAIARVDIGPRRQRSAELLEALDMADKADRLPHQLSGGEQQRAAIGVAMATRPPLLLADEPTGELDTETGNQVIQVIREMNRVYGVTAIIVTHHPGVVDAVDRTLHIRDGRISSESFMQPTLRRSGEAVYGEYLVVDRMGRLQLPQGYPEQVGMQRLASADIEGNQITIAPANAEPHSTEQAPKPGGSTLSTGRSQGAPDLREDTDPG